MTGIRRTLCLMLAFALTLSLGACSLPMKVIGSIPDPQKTVNAFFDNVCAGKFKEADQYLSGVSISMKKKVDDSFSQTLYDYLLDSYEYSTVGKMTVDNLDAECKVEFTYLSLNLLSGDLRDKAAGLGNKYMVDATEGYVEKTGDALTITDEGAKKIAEEALNSVMETPEKYYASEFFTIRLQYSGSRWLIHLSDELFNAICGGFTVEE